MKRFAKVLVAVGCAVSISSLALGQKAFNLVKVPNSNPDSATAINNAGQVIVNAGTPESYTVSLWNLQGGPQALDLTGGNNVGVAIDAGNDVAGAGDPDDSGNLKAFLWQEGGGVQWLGTLGGPVSTATGVNAGREVVGMSLNAADVPHAFLWSETGGMQDLTPSLTGSLGAIATGINTSGEAVGYYYPNGAANVVGFSWTQAGGLASFGAPGTMALAINDAGTTAGEELTASGARHAFSMQPGGEMVDLGTLGGDQSSAVAINNKGWIVGTSLTNDQSGVLHGFLWTPSGGMQDFTALSALGQEAEPYSIQINDSGDIAVSMRTQLVLLVPHMTATATSAPNPSVAGQPVTITATVNSIAGPPPDGETLQFFVGGLPAGTGTFSKGVAKVTVSGLNSGTHAVAVSYAGDTNYLPFRYTVFKQVVNP